MPTASIFQVVDALVQTIADEWEPEAPNSVSQRSLAPSGVMSQLHELHGRQVYLFAGPYDNEPATRGEESWSYNVGVRVINRYEPAHAADSDEVNAWVRDEVLWVEEFIVDLLDFGTHGPFLVIGGTRELLTETIAVNKLYDPDRLSEHKVFLSDVAINLREPVRAA